MATLPKCFLLPIDGTDESLRPIGLLKQLYPGSREVNLILSYFAPPLPPVYLGPNPTPNLAEKRRRMLDSAEKSVRGVFDHARKMLLEAGFSEDLLHEQVQRKEMSVARHACLLAEVRKVDAILVQKRVSSSLEGFLKGDPTPELLQHCLASPIWFTEGRIQVEDAAVCVGEEEAVIGIADHVGFMLSDNPTNITLVHVSKAVSAEVSFRLNEAEGGLASWNPASRMGDAGHYLKESARALLENGVDRSRIKITLIPRKRGRADDILAWCKANRIGILGVGHSQPAGAWAFLRSSVTKKILADFRNMAVWVTQ